MLMKMLCVRYRALRVIYSVAGDLLYVSGWW